MAKTRKISKGLTSFSIANTAPVNGQAVVYDGTQYTVGYGNYLLGRPFAISNLSTNQILAYSGAAWVNRALKTLTVASVSITGKLVTNTAGGDTVTITGTGFLPTPIPHINQIALYNVVLVSDTSITGTLPPVPVPGIYSLFLSNGDGECAVLTNAVTYVSPPTIVNDSNLGSFQNSVTLSVQFAMDVPPAYVFALTAGVIPAGLTLASSGLLSGSPIAAGTYNFTLLATDGRGQTASKVFAMTIT
jgi:hypothetical protein